MQRIIILTFIYFTLILPVLSGNASAEAVVNKVTILPFDTVDAGKYTNLKNGLRAMISGRLASQENIIVVTPTLEGTEQQLITEKYPDEASPLFKRLDTDYIGTGRMVLNGDKLQLQMTFYSAKDVPPISVTSEAEGDAQILSAVEILVLRVEEQVFGLKNDVSSKDIVATQKKGVEGFQTEHPDRQYKEEVISGSSVSSEGAGVAIARGDLVRRKTELEEGLITTAVGDIDGRGTEEILIVSSKKIKAMHYDRGLLKQLNQYELPDSLEPHVINIADLNDDGRSEIYLSAVDNNRFSSLIFDWSKEKGFQVIQDKIRFAIRPLILPDGSSFLAGQGRSPGGKKFLAPGVYVLEKEQNGKRFMRGKRMFLPPEVNIFDFIIADLDNDSVIEKIAVTRDSKLVVYDNNNNLLWRSTTDFAGGANYLGRRWTDDLNKQSGFGDTNKDGYTNADLYFIPVRLIAKDGNNDGKIDIIVAKNELSTFKVLKNLRSYKSGKVVCMGWDGIGMTEIWTTDTMDGYVADVNFTDEFSVSSLLQKKKDVDNKEKVRLFVGQVAAGGLQDLLPFGEVGSNLIVYEFKISSASPEIQGKE